MGESEELKSCAVKSRDVMQEEMEKLTQALAGKVNAHLFESIMSLFNSGVLKFRTTTLRTKVDPNNFKMTVEQSCSVTFEGREKIIELEKEVKYLNAKIDEIYKGVPCEICDEEKSLPGQNLTGKQYDEDKGPLFKCGFCGKGVKELSLF